MIGPKVIKESENYRVIERTGAPGEYRLQQHAGIWRTIKDYRNAGSAIKRMEKLEEAWKKA